MRTHLLQPPGSSLCGQTVVAMVLGITLDEAVSLVGKTGGTRLEDLETALGKKGVRLWPRVPGPPPMNGGGLYICSVRWKRGGHWLLIDGSRRLDPEGSYSWPREGRIVAFWEVRDRSLGGPLQGTGPGG